MYLSTDDPGHDFLSHLSARAAYFCPVTWSECPPHVSSSGHVTTAWSTWSHTGGDIARAGCRTLVAQAAAARGRLAVHRRLARASLQRSRTPPLGSPETDNWKTTLNSHGEGTRDLIYKHDETPHCSGNGRTARLPCHPLPAEDRGGGLACGEREVFGPLVDTAMLFRGLVGRGFEISCPYRASWNEPSVAHTESVEALALEAVMSRSKVSRASGRLSFGCPDR